jgi:formate--tetrahydrofolate ligase
MAVLLRDAIQPNLVQTLERTPAFVHGGPFANIAHGCNSLIATSAALKLADYVVTEAGFGADLGAEKFFDIKCRQSGLAPAAAVIVATVRALKMHGGVTGKAELGQENVAAVQAGMANLERHIENVRKFGVPVTVAINHFTSDAKAETDAIAEACRKLGVHAHLCRHWADGGRGAQDLARDVVALAEGGCDFKPLYPDDMRLADKIRTIAREIYRAADVSFGPTAERKLRQYETDGFGHLPICMAKTQYSFTAEPDMRGAPTGHILPVREVRLSAGAGFVVALCGDLMTMPGLPKDPAAYRIRVDADGRIEGLF